MGPPLLSPQNPPRPLRPRTQAHRQRATSPRRHHRSLHRSLRKLPPA